MKTNKVVIVMYHYIRNLVNSRYPNIKGLDIQLFRQQIAFFKQNFNIITCEQLLDSIANKSDLPENSMLLTFDDGYLEHYTNVFPILMENKIQGFFSMPGKILKEEKVLDVNKIHFILASTTIESILEFLFERLNFYRGREFDIPENQVIYQKLAVPGRFDNEKVIFIKRLLQAELDETLRNIIVEELFKEYIPVNESVFAKELYMNYDQIKLMKNSGMYFGIHGYEHYWFEKLPSNKMKRDIEQALEVFEDVVNEKEWIMCYPYGSYSNESKEYIRRIGCKLGFTTEVRVADIEKDDVLTLPRLDTNDFPPKSNQYLKIK